MRLSDFVIKRTSKGQRILCLKGFNGEKTGKVDLFNTTLREELLFHSCIEDPNDPFCPFNVFIRYIQHLPENWNGKLLLKGLNPDDRVRVKPDRNGLRKYADTSDHGPLGLNACNKICTRVARRVKLINPEKQLASGRRRAGITKIANAGLPVGEVMVSARHKSVTMSALYQVETEEAHDKRHEAQRYNVSFFCVFFYYYFCYLTFFIFI